MPECLLEVRLPSSSSLFCRTGPASTTTVFKVQTKDSCTPLLGQMDSFVTTFPAVPVTPVTRRLFPLGMSMTSPSPIRHYRQPRSRPALRPPLAISPRITIILSSKNTTHAKMSSVATTFAVRQVNAGRLPPGFEKCVNRQGLRLHPQLFRMSCRSMPLRLLAPRLLMRYLIVHARHLSAPCRTPFLRQNSKHYCKSLQVRKFANLSIIFLWSSHIKALFILLRRLLEVNN
ncbi:hypothetical protein LMH87_001557 [Akanthomyces muscarius]|uniref:Uncharacterized protein n=1 Tax=Akanthomyces muscarius TaxID=2231603 RepID=A0A9W8Q5X0_AKAMU|nr:hypothetical protein LMH87_001557 [Akanthomyces muscarius]KAJ4147004.1 hypothetical protein LMH87_001557 [Akanthomyces muscarius]